MCVLIGLALLGATAADPIAVLRAMPPTIAGLHRRDDPHRPANAPMRLYEGAHRTDPMIVVAAGRAAPSTTPADLRTAARHQPISIGLLDTMFEGRFAVPGRPAAKTFFGEYLTERGLVQLWLVENAGIRTTVSATVFRIEDRRRVFDAVRRELLGGAYMVSATTQKAR